MASVRGGRGYCFRCGSYSARVIGSQPGGQFFPWTRRRRACLKCGTRWNTVEVIDPADDLAPSRRAYAEPVEVELPALLSAPSSVSLAWQGALTWEVM